MNMNNQVNNEFVKLLIKMVNLGIITGKEEEFRSFFKEINEHE